MKFRDDINASRAIAVLAVVLFHFFPAYLSGGFVGVDVFFVISGYLMTSIVVDKIGDGRFSLFSFYLSRMTRIVPALVVMCLVATAVGWFLLSPWDYRALSKHVISSLLFFSNYIYFIEAGSYFEAQEFNKFMLHTWSLSVEFQFYLLYPLLLLSIIKLFGVARLKTALLVLFIAGFLLSLHGSIYNPKAAFYLMPFRFWEFMAGAMAAVIPLRLDKKVSGTLSLTGLLMIFVSCLLLEEGQLWPGFFALLPVVGTFLVIWCRLEDTPIGRLFCRQPPVRWLGNISYSLYIWHWPIAVYVGIVGGAVWGVLLSLLMAHLSYQYIEKVFSKKIKDRSLAFLSFSMAASGLFAVSAVMIFTLNGLPQRQVIAPVADALPTEFRYCDKRPVEQACVHGQTKKYWAIIGDSHSLEPAQALFDLLDKDHIGLKQYSYSACHPASNSSQCDEWTEKVFEKIIKDAEVENVVLAYRLTPVMVSHPELVYDRLEKYLQKLAATKQNVFLVMPIPELPDDISSLYMAKYFKTRDISTIEGVRKRVYQDENSMFFEAVSSMSLPENVSFLDPLSALCDEDTCYAVRDSVAYYFDDNHLSVAGARKLVNSLLSNSSVVH